MTLKLTKWEQKNVFHLPVQQAVLVPSTTRGDQHISAKSYNKRIQEVKKYLSTSFGGFTAVSARGGYYSDKKKKVIQEPVAVVTSFATTKAYNKGITPLKKQLGNWAGKWKQESMGYENEGDLYYYPARK